LSLEKRGIFIYGFLENPVVGEAKVSKVFARPCLLPSGYSNRNRLVYRSQSSQISLHWNAV